MDGLLRLKGQAKTIDLVGISYDIRRQAVVLADFMDFVEDQFDEILARPGVGSGLPSALAKNLSDPLAQISLCFPELCIEGC